MQTMAAIISGILGSSGGFFHFPFRVFEDIECAGTSERLVEISSLDHGVLNG